MVQINCCNGSMMQGTLGDALKSPVPQYEQVKFLYSLFRN